jgi:chemotaxis protein methyltransferase CheR
VRDAIVENEIRILGRWIYNEFHIDISAYKSNQMNRRLTNLMARSGASSVGDYIRMLERNPKLKQKLADFITINVSEFFRNKELFDDLQDKIDKLLLKEKPRIKIWSAACSNGAEPYSITIIMDRLTPGVKHSILATDVDATILEAAKKGEYTANDVKNVDNLTLQRYFKKVGDKYILNEDIKNRVRFKKHDLILDPYESGFDLIVCRNVVIYFTQDVKDAIYKKFYDSLNDGGLLFVGATETIYNYKDFGFGKASTFIYQKKKLC